MAYIILGVTVVVYLLQELSRFALGGIDLPAGLGLKANQAIMEGQVWRLFTPLLLHASLLHIGANMYSLYALGPGLEIHYGRWRFLAVYILSGFSGNVFSFIFTTNNSLGASTAIFGLVGAYGVFLYQNRVLLGDRARKSLMNVIVIAAINLLIGLSGGIDNWGHVGGLIGGLIFAWWGGPLLAVGGIQPDLKIVDRRESGDVLRAGILAGGIFVLLAAGTIIWRLQGL
jgi:rhomboid protease GluP